jgi:hypothetical protein
MAWYWNALIVLSVLALLGVGGMYFISWALSQAEESEENEWDD